uniref:transposase n=1 Tax=Phocaeicola oris TaxID=2896850 RepID=UPI0038B34717
MKLYADKRYILQSSFEKLFIDDIRLMTKLRKNMKDFITLLQNRIMLRKRFTIDTVNDDRSRMYGT